MFPEKDKSKPEKHKSKVAKQDLRYFARLFILPLLTVCSGLHWNKASG